MYLGGMLGLGDNFFQRAIVRELGPLHLMTSWPQLYEDLPQIKCVRPQTHLRTQAKNAARPYDKWCAAPNETQQRINYNGQGSMLDSLARSAGLYKERLTFDGPPVAKTDNHPYIVIRPATLRGEWMAAARNPKPEYLARTAEALSKHYDIISIADIDGTNEYAVEPLPFAHETYHKGELPIEELLELVGNASAVVGGVGWLLPAAMAYKVPMLLLYGGWGQINGPDHVLDRRIDSSMIHQVFPDRFCMCNDRSHDCDKTISHLDAEIDKFLLRLAGREVSRLVA